MKLVEYHGGVVCFRIPSHWREEYSEFDGGMFYENSPESGTVRLKITSLKAPRDLQHDSGMNVLQMVVNTLQNAGVKVRTHVRSDGNASLKYEEETSENGIDLQIIYWVIANPIPPRRARITTFSYTIPSHLRQTLHVQRELDMLDAEIEAARFAPEFGVTSR